MRRPHGYLLVTDPAQPAREWDTVTCAHCQRIVIVKPATAATVYLVPHGRAWHEEPGAFCRVCMAPVCLACHARGVCEPWERRLDQIEAQARLRRSVGR